MFFQSNKKVRDMNKISPKAMLRSTAQACAAVCAAAALALAPSFVPQAEALPPGGANGSNTGNSVSTVSPTTVQRCSTLNYQLRNFAPNTMVSVKFDDGQLSSQDQSQQGAGVVARQMSDGSGNVSGTLNIGCNFPTGTHWLRFLATERKGDSDRETLGWSNRSPNFTVVEKASKPASQGQASGGNQGAKEQKPATGGQKQNQSRGNAGSNNSVGSNSAQGNKPKAKNSISLNRGGNSGGNSGGASGGSGGAGAPGGALDSSPGEEGDDGEDASLAVLDEGDDGSNDQGSDATQQDNTQLSAASQNRKDRAPIMGAVIGGAILIVGFAAMALWYVTTERRRRADAQLLSAQHQVVVPDAAQGGYQDEASHPSTATFSPQSYDPHADYGPPQGPHGPQDPHSPR
ncbi:hypothetical protein CPPEL_09615 [Corynebacterium pseudopelargi]|uniref:Uncharacterized protein n=2 Tax=Corynebacterium pseudopelargi TaxID=2080757 RepID=A0A3G6IWL2_9CORY|nr:hypothetical protein CPPEL_09615 [Corynebacterium pseudopelargi]